MSTSTMMMGSGSNVSAIPDPFNTSLPPSSLSSYYKSLPALDKQHDQLDKELRHLSESVDILYEQEDNEIEFLDSFIDYDDIVHMIIPECQNLDLRKINKWSMAAYGKPME